ncbi:MAG: hypothetical protein HYZ53_27770, partial [Planctomycetes bacterium]|nr:hypothetical protein [Planctomycetota bacterium]
MRGDTTILPPFRVQALSEVDPETAEPIGGKARTLARLVHEGFPVPRGYCVSWPSLFPPPPHEAVLVPGLREAVARAWTALGRSAVAVRSSGEAEDGVLASLAGQLTTTLGLRALDAILSGITKCVASASGLRVQAYERDLGSPKEMRVGVVVQEMIRADFAGVLFTANPRSGDRNQWVVEAAHGTCEDVVSGKVQPAQALLPRPTAAGGGGGGGGGGGAGGGGAGTAGGEGAGSVKLADPILTPSFPLPIPILTRLCSLAVRIEALFGNPQDIEWCVARDHVWILQSRPITALQVAAERERALAAAVSELRERTAGRTVVWNRSTLADVLSEPLPLSWAVARRFMSGSGAYGRAHQAFGFEFSPELGQDGIAELILGRTFVNLDREARTYFGALPVRIDVEALRKDPRASSATPRPDVRAFSFGTWLSLPGLFVRGFGMERKARALLAAHAQFVRGTWAPALVARVRAE